MVNSQLDYCNSLLHGLSKGSVTKLQKVQNLLCCIVFKLDIMSHVTPNLENNWVPITCCILLQYNLL